MKKKKENDKRKERKENIESKKERKTIRLKEMRRKERKKERKKSTKNERKRKGLLYRMLIVVCQVKKKVIIFLSPISLKIGAVVVYDKYRFGMFEFSDFAQNLWKESD